LVENRRGRGIASASCDIGLEVGMGRFMDDGRTIYELGDQFLVRCPRCSRRAEVLAPQGYTDIFDPRRVSCGHCGYTKEWIGTETAGPEFRYYYSISGRHTTIRIGGSFDRYFGLPLWLQTPCCGHVLWAYNSRHLSFLRHYVSAELRERSVMRTTSLASRLPKWIKSAKNRDEVLKGLDRLDALLLES
jgi:ribosomal protein S27AE